MKKAIIIWTAILVSATYATTLPRIDVDGTTTHSSRSIGENVGTENKEKFFYNKGFTDGFSEGKKVGYEQAMKEAKSAIRKYKKRIKAYEAGKYISKKGKITPPRIYQNKRSDGSVSVVVEGCKIEGELSPDDILMFPAAEGISGEERSASTVSNKRFREPAISDSVFLAGVDEQEPIPVASSSLKKATYKIFPDSDFYRKLMRGAGVPFSIQEDGKIRAIFKSLKDANRFIQQYDLTAEKDYR